MDSSDESDEGLGPSTYEMKETAITSLRHAIIREAWETDWSQEYPFVAVRSTGEYEDLCGGRDGLFYKAISKTRWIAFDQLRSGVDGEDGILVVAIPSVRVYAFDIDALGGYPDEVKEIFAARGIVKFCISTRSEMKIILLGGVKPSTIFDLAHCYEVRHGAELMFRRGMKKMKFPPARTHFTAFLTEGESFQPMPEDVHRMRTGVEERGIFVGGNFDAHVFPFPKIWTEKVKLFIWNVAKEAEAVAKWWVCTSVDKAMTPCPVGDPVEVCAELLLESIPDQLDYWETLGTSPCQKITGRGISIKKFGERVL